MNFIKRNKGTIITIVLFLILVVGLFQVKTVFFPNKGKPVYGDRLEGIEKVEISDKTYKEVETKLLQESVSKTSTSITGKIVKIFITVKPEVSLETAKSYGNKALEPFTAEQKKFYDFQIYIQKDGESPQFPIIGYKNHSSANISWTKDR